VHENADDFRTDHRSLTRRFFLRFGSAGAVAFSTLPSWIRHASAAPDLEGNPFIEKLEPWLTKPDDFGDVSRGNPRPHSLSEEKRKEVGLTRDTWQLEVISDPKKRAALGNPLTKKNGNALTFAKLSELAKTRAVRFPKVMTCLNIGCPLGMGIWEGVPLRDVIWMAKPQHSLRRVFYYGYHNDDPDQMFRSSLPVGRILEDPPDTPPVILCYKLNGQWLTPKRGGPVRVVVPEAYGFKNIKWLTHVVLSNEWRANDTYGDQNNDVDSPLKTFCATLAVTAKPKPMQAIAMTGWAQVGVSGLRKIQVWIHNDEEELSDDDPYFTKAPWRDATILPRPKAWGGGIPHDRIPQPTFGFDPKTGEPETWPLRLAKAHWAALLPGLPAGNYTLRCRTIDANGTAQPMPRPFRKSGRAAIEEVSLKVEG